MLNTKLRVAVLFGGNSHEKEISLESGRNIVYKLPAHTYQVMPLFVSTHYTLHAITATQLMQNTTQEIAHSLVPDQLVRWHDLPNLVDFVFIGLHGGLGENGGVQGTLEMLGLPYNGSGVLASALCMDKYKTTQYVQSQGFAVPKSQLVTHTSWQTEPRHVIARLVQGINFPCIVKPHDDGCSFMVQKVVDQTGLATALANLFASEKQYAMVEEFITGMELTVGVIGNDTVHALPPSQAVAHGTVLSIEEKFLPGAGENQTPAPLPEDTLTLVQRTVEGIYRTVGCKGYARIDCFYQTAEQSSTGVERVVTIEVNTLPGMTPATCLFHQAAEVGLKPAEFIDLIIQFGFQEHGKAQPHTEHVIEQITTRIRSVQL